MAQREEEKENMNNLWQKLKRNIEKEKDIVLSGTIFILIFLLWLFFFLLPSIETIRHNEIEIREIENRQNNLIKSMERIAKSKHMMRLYKNMVLNGDEVSRVILNLDRIIKQSGVNLMGLYPLQEKGVVRYGIAYTVVSVRIVATSTFKGLQKLINAITKMNGFYDISSISIKNPVFIPPNTVKLKVVLDIDSYFIKKKRNAHVSKS